MATTEPSVPDLQTTEELARTWRVKPGTIRQWRRRGIIEAIRPGLKPLLFNPRDVEDRLLRRGQAFDARGRA